MSTFALVLCFASGSCAPPTIMPNLETCDSLAVEYHNLGSRNRNYTYTKCVEYPARVPLDIQWLGSWRDDDYEIDDHGKIIKQHYFFSGPNGERYSDGDIEKSMAPQRCRSFLEATNDSYKHWLQLWLARRKISEDECRVLAEQSTWVSTNTSKENEQ